MMTRPRLSLFSVMNCPVVTELSDDELSGGEFTEHAHTHTSVAGPDWLLGQPVWFA